MNLYFLVEGKRTEKKVYPRWIRHLIPKLTQIDNPYQATQNCFFLFSGEGYPSLLTHLKNSILEINETGKFQYLVVCLDADEVSVEERKQEIHHYITSEGLKPQNFELKIIVQNRCFETWGLGNRRIFPRTPQNPQLVELIQHYNVSSLDPELSGIAPGFENHASCHLEYLKLILQERNIRYTKKNPGDLAEPHYVNELVSRIENSPTHLATFKTFYDFCQNMNQ